MQNFTNEIEKFLFPIEQEMPCGQNLKGKEQLTKIQGYRSHFNTSTQSDLDGFWTAEDENFSKWQEISLVCEDIFKHKSKDLFVVGYYMEAELYLHGLKGLAKSLLLLKEFCDLFWENIYPLIKKDIPEIRSAPFRWMNKNITQQIHIINLAQNTNLEIQLLNYQNKSKKEVISSLINEPLEYLKHSLELIEYSQKLLAEIDSYLTLPEENEEPFLTDFIACLQSLNSLFTETIKNKIKFQAEVQIQKDTAPKIQNSNEVSSVEPRDNTPSQQKEFFSYKPTDRKSAYEMIEYANCILLELEPQSPVPQLINRALKLSKLSFQELLKNIVDSAQDKAEVMRLFGINNDALPME